MMSLLVVYAPPWLWFPGGFALAAMLIRWHRTERGGELRWQPAASGGGWHWQPQGSRESQPVALHCHYLGPWLIGLRMGREMRWLWPDSSDRDALRRLRRWLVGEGP
ncbi:hypothetical protein [Halomonas gudaonensis]